MRSPVHIACLQTQPQAKFRGRTGRGSGTWPRLRLGRVHRCCSCRSIAGGLRTKGRSVRTACPLPEASHPVLTGLRDFAQAHDVWILCGIGCGARQRRKGGINRSLLLDRTGTVVSRYDKLHLFDIQLSDQEVYRESARVTPGATLRGRQTSVGL